MCYCYCVYDNCYYSTFLEIVEYITIVTITVEHTETTAVSHGTSRVTCQRCKYTTLVDIQKCTVKS